MSTAPSPNSSRPSNSKAYPRAQAVQPSLDWAWRWVPVIAWLCLISWFSSSTFSGRATARYIDPLILWLLPRLSREGLNFAHFVIRKGAHVTEYCILAVLMLRAFRPPLLASWHKAVWMTLGACAAYAFADELHQYFVQGRTASLKDVAFDFTGALAGVAAFLALALPHRRRPRESLPAFEEKSLSASDRT